MKNNGLRLWHSSPIRLRILVPLALLIGILGSPLEASAQEKRVTLNLTNVTLEQFLDAVKAQSGLSVSVESTDINLSARVSASYNNQPLNTVLRNVLGGQNLNFEIKDNHIVVFRQASNPPSGSGTPAGTVSGKIVDKNGQPVIGATIMVEGTTRGTTSDAGGLFSIAASGAGARLSVSFIGY